MREIFLTNLPLHLRWEQKCQWMAKFGGVEVDSVEVRLVVFSERSGVGAALRCALSSTEPGVCRGATLNKYKSELQPHSPAILPAMNCAPNIWLAQGKLKNYFKLNQKFKINLTTPNQNLQWAQNSIDRQCGPAMCRSIARINGISPQAGRTMDASQHSEK